jgi:hypothetical protein
MMKKHDALASRRRYSSFIVRFSSGFPLRPLCAFYSLYGEFTCRHPNRKVI